MSIHMNQLSVNRILMDANAAEAGTFEFAVDCGAVYFGAVYDGDGTLMAVDQYFYSQDFSRDDMEDAVGERQLLSVDSPDFPSKAYLLSREMAGNEWLRFHAVVPETIEPDYFYHKYLGE